MKITRSFDIFKLFLLRHKSITKISTKLTTNFIEISTKVI